MTDNLPAVRPTAEVATADTDSWINVMANVARLAEHIAETEFVPKNLRNKAPAVAAAILYGREVGLPPMTSLTQTHVIEGRPSMSAEAMRALVVAGGHEFVTEETTGAVCRMRARRRGSETWTVIEWTIDMARAAGLMGKDNWKNYPRQMLQARCTAELVRLVFPDVIHGFRALEELDEAGEADDAATAFGQPASSTVRRQTPARKKAAVKKAAAAQDKPAERPAQLEGPPLPGEPGYEDMTPTAEGASSAGDEAQTPPADEQAPERVEEPAEDLPADDTDDTQDERQPEPEKGNPGKPVSRAQQRMMHAQFHELGIGGDDDREERLLITSKIIGRPVDSSNNMTSDEAKALLDTLGRCKQLADVHAVLDAIDEHAERQQGE